MGSYVVYGFSDESTFMPPNRYPGQAFFAWWEIIPAAASAGITTCYAIQHEIDINNEERLDVKYGILSYLPNSTCTWRPGPGMMLAACLVFGCCISSYSFRRQEEDRYQTVFFVIAICAACAVGSILETNPSIIMLGYIPWGLCLAIIASALSHWAMRQCETNTRQMPHNFEDSKVAW